MWHVQHSCWWAGLGRVVVHPPFVMVGDCARIAKAQLVHLSRLFTAWQVQSKPLYGAYLSMEGTLGAADCVLFRERMPDAALVDHACVVHLRWARDVCLLVRRTVVSGISSRSLQRVRDRRCSSRSGWGEASVLSDQGGGEHAWHCRVMPLARDVSVDPSRKG
jgi:hypothetical protein